MSCRVISFHFPLLKVQYCKAAITNRVWSINERKYEDEQSNVVFLVKRWSLPCSSVRFQIYSTASKTIKVSISSFLMLGKRGKESSVQPFVSQILQNKRKGTVEITSESRVPNRRYIPVSNFLRSSTDRHTAPTFMTSISISMICLGILVGR